MNDRRAASARRKKGDLFRAVLLTAAFVLSLTAAAKTREESADRVARNSTTAPLLQTTSDVQVVRRQRLGNDTEDITYYLTKSGNRNLAIMDGYDVLDPSLPAPSKLFDVLSLGVKAAPRGITFAEIRNLFVFSDTTQPTKLFLTDTTGRPRSELNIQYLGGVAPQFVEGLAYIPVRGSNLIRDRLVLVATFLNADSELESRLEIINFSGQVEREIIPQNDLSTIFLTGVSYKAPGGLLVSSDDDQIIYELDFSGNLLASYDGTAQTPPSLHGIEGIAQTPAGKVAAAGGLDGIIDNVGLNTDPSPQLAFDYRIGPGLSRPSGIAWNSDFNEFLLLASNREQAGDPFISRLASSFVTTEIFTPVDGLTRKITYLPDEQLTAATHTSNPRGILLFDRKGNPAGQISTSQFGIPQVISYIPTTREFVLVFRDTLDPTKRSKLFVLTRTGELSRIIDLAPLGVTRITAAAYFNPSHPTGGQFLVVDGDTNTAFVTDFMGTPLDNFSVREKLGILSPSAVTAITTTRDAGALAITDTDSSQVVIFRLGSTGCQCILN